MRGLLNMLAPCALRADMAATARHLAVAILGSTGGVRMVAPDLAAVACQPATDDAIVLVMQMHTSLAHACAPSPPAALKIARNDDQAVTSWAVPAVAHCVPSYFSPAGGSLLGSQVHT